VPKKKKELIRDKYWEEDRPGFDYDFVEWLVAPDELDAIVRANSERFGFITELDPTDFLPDRKRQEELLKQIYESAAKTLTKQQYKIFIMRYLCSLKEEDIARQMDVSQAYVAATLPVIHSKIRQILSLEPLSHRGRKKNTYITRNKPTKKKHSKKPLKKS
jgi:hypothetical protein